jgi:hypothetical protein
MARKGPVRSRQRFDDPYLNIGVSNMNLYSAIKSEDSEAVIQSGENGKRDLSERSVHKKVVCLAARAITE